MSLTLTVLRCPPSVAPEVRQVTGGEYSIGRGPDTDWVLPDPTKYLSKRHCVIAFRQGTWQIAGTSTNGTFINRSKTPLEEQVPHVLANGDRLILGVYEIEATLAEDARTSWGGPAQAAPPPPDPFSNPFGDDPFAPAATIRPAPHVDMGDPGLSAFSTALPADFNPLLPDDDIGPSREDHSSAVSDAFTLPPVKTALPADWDLEDFVASAPVPTPTPAPAPAPLVREPARRVVMEPVAETPVPTPAVQPGAGPHGDLLEAFLRGAGLQDIDLPDPLRTMEQLGASFRALVSGIRGTLIARSEVKREFRIEATQIRQRGNNLLKFSANDDDALIGLLGAGRRTDMAPDEAITDALTDIHQHEIATMTAMQAAVRALVMRLGPDQIRDGKELAGGLALLSNAKGKAWDAYQVLHARVLRDLEDDFDSVFGKRFAIAYEQAMHDLAAQRKTGRDGR
jgi:type VI secretion system protein ImpI